MKKALIIFAVLLVLGGILFGLYHFLWTAENFASLGRSALEDGNYDRAISRYETAVELDPDNTEYILALVDACLADGRYTTAEQTLVSAIRKSPTTALYCKLSAVYVAQDKLLDAQKMLDGITDASVLEEISALRPQAPSFTPEAGAYSEYISVALTAENAVIYYSTDEQYPSTKTIYNDPFSLPTGVSEIHAVAVGGNSLVSPLASAKYEIVGVVEEVSFASAELEAYVRELLYVARTEAVMTNQLWTLTDFTVPQNVTDYSDLRYFTNLTSLTINNSAVDDYSFLTTLTGLQTLDLNGCLVSAQTLGYIALLPNLQVLKLSGCGLSNIEPLGNLSTLISLDLSENSISVISALADCKELSVLNLANNAVTSLSSLADIDHLTELDITGNSIATLAPLADCDDLLRLTADHNSIDDLTPLKSMTKLTQLTLSNNAITDISALAACTKLERLDLSYNQITAVDVIADFVALGYLDISHNQITALPTLSPGAQLRQFYAAYNQLEDISVLAGLPQLTYVDVDYNEAIEDVECLTSCPLLVQVNAFGTAVNEYEKVSKLEAMGVIVNFNPIEEDEEE